MRNKGFFWSVTIALALACIYQLSFTWVTYRVNGDAEDYAHAKLDSLRTFNVPYVVCDRDTLNPADSANNKDVDKIINFYVDEYLRAQANEEVYFNFTYSECQENEINLGLDLQGGMSVTLEISVPELVADLAGNTRNPAFKKAYDEAVKRAKFGEGDFIDLFVEEWEKDNADESLAKIFSIRNAQEIASNASNDEVKTFLKDQASSALDGIEIIIEKRVNTFGVAQPTIQKITGSNRIFVELPGVKDQETVKRKLQSTANLEFYECYNNVPTDGQPKGIGEILFGAESTIEQELSEALFGDKEKLVDPVDTTGADTTLQQPADTNKVNNLLQSVENDNELLNNNETNPTDTSSELSVEEQMKKYPLRSFMSPNLRTTEEGQFLAEGPIVGFAHVKDTSTVFSRLNHPIVKAKLPEDLQFMWGSSEIEDPSTGLNTGLFYLYAIKAPSNGPMVSGDDIDNSYHSQDPQKIGEYEVVLNFTSLGSEKWEEMTAANIDKPVAITMDDYVFSAPYVREKMSNRSSITGGFDLYEAKDLAGLLNAGALPAPVKIVNGTVVGPSLGTDNIRSGLWSFAFALGLVLVYMIFYYSKAGVIADLALIVNIFFLIGALASMKAILTLPGIAGIVLTIGMSVDANVLIFERIREELRHGKGKKGAVKDGFKKALAAILDANITTLLTGFVLAAFGTGPIKGFATTLIIGIFTSFFAAVVITRLIVNSLLDRDKDVSFASRFTEKWFTNAAIPFVKKRKLFYLISGGLVTLGIVSLLTRSLDLGVDFTGGRQYVVQFEQPADYDGIRSNLTKEFEGNAPTVKRVEDKFTAMITTKYLIEESSDSDSLVKVKLENGLKEFGNYDIRAENMIAPTISKDLKANSFYAIGFSLLIIFIYIVFRFRKWQYGLGALIAMIHDVLIVLSLFSIFYGILPFSMEVDQAFIAAILTVVGYSINDTVVVFDRIREYLNIHHKKGQREVIDMALNSTLSRTINTSVTTFIVLLVIFLFGGDAIKGFTFALMVGIVVGTYSSLFIATPAVIDFSKKEAGDKAKEVE